MAQRRTTALLALGIALAAPAAALAPASASAATADGFTAVADLPGTSVTSLVSPVDGEAYVSGRSASGAFLRHATASGVTDVAVPDATSTTTVQLAHDGRTTYALVDGRLYTLAGDTLTPMALPATTPTGGYPVKATTITAADGLLWVGTPVQYFSSKQWWTALVALRWDGTTWTSTAPTLDHLSSTPTTYGPATLRYAKGRSVYAAQASTSAGTSDEAVSVWDGATWQQPWLLGRHYTSSGTQNGSFVGTAWTFVDHPGTDDARDYVVWGYEGVNGTSTSASAPTGTCRHVRRYDDSPCAAPAWPVTAATRLADGRTVVGGADGVGGLASTTPGAFALVDGEGATPAPLRGDNDSQVAALAAAPSGTTVWAVTQTGLAGSGTGATGQRLQRVTLDADATPNPAPAPIPEQLTWQITNYAYKVDAMDMDVLPGRPAVALAGIDGSGRVQVWSRGAGTAGEAYPSTYAAPADGVTVRAVTDAPATATSPRPFYVLAHGKAGAPDTLLLTSDGGFAPTVTKVDLPATVPGTSDPMPTSFALAVEGSTVYLVGRVPTTGRAVVVQRTGTTGAWTARVSPFAVDSVSREAWVKDGGLFVRGTYAGTEIIARVTGDAWYDVTRTGGTDGTTTWSLRDVVPTSATGSTVWGSATVAGRATGACQVNAPWPVRGCTAPPWAVTTAARLDDGRTILGGDGTAPGGATGATGIALADGPDAAPRSLELLLPKAQAWMSSRGDAPVVKVAARGGAQAGAWALVRNTSTEPFMADRKYVLLWSDLTR